MDVVYLSRLQFAATAMFHFLFVPLTLGLAVLIAIWETMYVRTGDEDYKRAAKFWGRLFIINFTVGVVTGITLEFQFGTNWSRYSQFVGDIFGSLLAIEATVAFFLESTFLAVWIFGWEKLSPKFHAACIWLVAFASTTSAYWIIAANSFMQNPTGFEVRNGRAELTDFLAVITQPATITRFTHVVFGAYILAGFFVMGVCAYHFLKKQHVEFFRKSFRTAVYFTLIFTVLVVIQGHQNGVEVAHKQPEKLAALEAIWETEKGAPLTLFMVPDEANQRNIMRFGEIPGLLSLIIYYDRHAEIKGLLDFPEDERPPVLIPFLGFRIMGGLGFLFPVIALTAWWLLWKDRLTDYPLVLKGLIAAIPLPYIALEAGWAVTEVGRQPWLVYRVLKTAEGASPVDPTQVIVSFAAFIAVYSLLGGICFYLLWKYARRGPEVQTAPEKEVGSHA